ncbi:unnamed protein product [Diamesa serratosioi]
MSNPSQNIEFYIKNIEKFEQSGEKDRLLHCLKKLYAIPISVQILQETGIRNTVGSVRKHNGEVGNLARKLIFKWKETLLAGAEMEGYKDDPDEFKRPIKMELMDDYEPPIPRIDKFDRPIKLEPVESIRHIQIKTEAKSPTESSKSKSSKSSHHKSHHKHHSSSSSSKEIKEPAESSERRKESKHHEKHDKRASSGQPEKSHTSSKRKHNDSLIDSKEATSDDDRGATASKYQKIDSYSSRSSKSSSHKDKERHKHSSDSSSKHTEKSKSNKDKNKDKDSSSSSSKKHSSSKKSSSSSSQSKKDHHNHHHHKTSSKSKHVEVEAGGGGGEEEGDEIIDNSEGMGFAEALAMFDMPSTSRRKDSCLADKPIRSSVPAKKPHSEHRASMSSIKDTKTSSKVLLSQPSMLRDRSRLDPLTDISTSLIPDYKPMPFSPVIKDYLFSSLAGNGKPQKPEKTDKELEFESFSSKANRTKVFSGNKQQQRSDIPSLFEMCIRILQENIDGLEVTGGIPFDILRPVLERAKPNQLANIEYYNPYLVEESDVLWEPHCKRKFRTKKREEMEAWREMYERCLIEDEEKLAKLTKNIKKHQETSIPVQKTKLAYVDQMVKAPRDMRRRQEINGTNRRLVVSSAARVESLKNLQPNLVAAGDARLRVAAGIRDDAEWRPARVNKIRPAPLMARTRTYNMRNRQIIDYSDFEDCIIDVPD